MATSSSSPRTFVPAMSATAITPKDPLEDEEISMDEIERLRDNPEFKLFLAKLFHARKNRDSIHESNEESAVQNEQARADTECMPVLPLTEENFDVSSNPSREPQRVLKRSSR